MNFSEENIRDYVQGLASPELMAAIRAEVDKNPELKEKVDLQTLANKAVHISRLKHKLDAARGRFEENESKVSPNTVEPQKSRIFSMKPLLAIAATLLVAMVLSIVIIKTYTKESPIDSYLAGDPGLPTLMGSHSDSLQSAMVDYKSGNLDQAEVVFKLLSEAHPQDDTYAYYLANIDLKKKRYDKAYTAFSLLLSSQKYKIHAQWYLTLIDLKNGKKPALDDLKRIASDPQNIYARDAGKILDAM